MIDQSTSRAARTVLFRTMGIVLCAAMSGLVWAGGIAIEDDPPTDSAPWRTDPDPYDDDRIDWLLRPLEHLRLGGRVEFRSGLIDRDDDDTRAYRPSIRLRTDWRRSNRVSAVAELRFDHLTVNGQQQSESANELRLGEAYLAWSGIGGAPFEIRAGRQEFEDRREWVYDQNLDALRIAWSPGDLRFELSASTTLSDGIQRDEDSTNWIAMLSRTRSKGTVAGYAVYRNIDSQLEETPLHLGFRSHGRWVPQTESWMEVALLTGARGRHDLRAYGIDLGATWAPAFADRLSFTLGYALGSGGRTPADGRDDKTFRQTGFQDNTGRFAGVTAFRYYGEVLDPELSNLAILTAGIGGRIGGASSLDLVYHDYEQQHAQSALMGTNVDGLANGVDADLGWGVDLVFGGHMGRHWSVEAVAGYFGPGRAFDGGPLTATQHGKMSSPLHEDDDLSLRVSPRTPTSLLKVQLRYHF